MKVSRQEVSAFHAHVIMAAVILLTEFQTLYLTEYGGGGILLGFGEHNCKINQTYWKLENMISLRCIPEQVLYLDTWWEGEVL